MKERVFVLGAGWGQLPLIAICKQRNFETIAISIDGNYPGFSVADRFYKIDIRDKERILEAAKRENIIGIMTDQVDVGVSSVAYVSEKMGLPGIGYLCALRFTNKKIMRNTARQLGVRVPEFLGVSKMDEAREAAKGLGFPVVIKPVDSDGSRGVVKVNSQEELEENFENSMSYSKVKEVLVEQFISGKEFEVQGFAHDYHHVNLLVGNSIGFDVPNVFIPKTRIYKDAESANGVEKEILETHQKLIEGFRLSFGNTQGEYIYDEQRGEIYLVEVCARGGGAFISSDLIPLACGINVNERLVDFATGQKKKMDWSLRRGTASYNCFALPAGRICRIDNLDKIKEISGVHKVFLDSLQVGQTVEEMKDKSGRFGPILISGEDHKSCEDTLQQVKDTLIIQVETESDGIRGIIW